LNKLGALWEKEGKNGKYFSGTVSGKPVVIFSNSYKENEKQPDWIVYEGKGKPEGYQTPYKDDESEVPF
jgi:hypothetical protein